MKMREHVDTVTEVAELFGLVIDAGQIEAMLPVFEELYRHILVLREIDVGDVEPGIGFRVEKE